MIKISIYDEHNNRRGALKLLIEWELIYNVLPTIRIVQQY
jgi:hypothetical protein